VPLVIVIAISMLREAVEDFLRSRSDIKQNSMLVEFKSVCQNNEYTDFKEWSEVKSSEVTVGGLIMLHDN